MSENNLKEVWNLSLNQIEKDYKEKGKELDFKLWFKMEYIITEPSTDRWISTALLTLTSTVAVSPEYASLTGVNVMSQSGISSASSPQLQRSIDISNEIISMKCFFIFIWIL